MKNKATVSVTYTDADRAWWVVDLADQDIAIGRVASRIASILRGKHKPSYTPHNDNGDFVIVLNADNAKFTGKKEEDKVYYHHTGYFGGIKAINVADLRKKNSPDLVLKAVKGMLPKTPLGRKMFGKLKVYAGGEHPHTAQQPQVLDLSKH